MDAKLQIVKTCHLACLLKNQIKEECRIRLRMLKQQVREWFQRKTRFQKNKANTTNAEKLDTTRYPCEFMGYKLWVSFSFWFSLEEPKIKMVIAGVE